MFFELLILLCISIISVSIICYSIIGRRIKSIINSRLSDRTEDGYERFFASIVQHIFGICISIILSIFTIKYPSFQYGQYNFKIMCYYFALYSIVSSSLPLELNPLFRLVYVIKSL